MKLHKYADDPLVKELTRLSDAATPGPWTCQFKDIATHTSFAYLVPPREVSPECVSLGSNRVSGDDQRFVAALVNAWRDGRLTVILEAA